MEVKLRIVNMQFNEIYFLITGRKEIVIATTQPPTEQKIKQAPPLHFLLLGQGRERLFGAGGWEQREGLEPFQLRCTPSLGSCAQG